MVELAAGVTVDPITEQDVYNALRYAALRLAEEQVWARD